MPVMSITCRTKQAVWCLALFLATLQVSAPAAASCDATVSLVDFGRLDLERGGQVTGEVIVNCDEPGRFSIGLSEGIGQFVQRKMRGSDGAELVYNLFVDPSRQRIWGDGISAGTQTVKGENDGRRPSVIPIYGNVPSRQTVLVGPYSDNLLVTVEKL